MPPAPPPAPLRFRQPRFHTTPGFWRAACAAKLWAGLSEAPIPVTGWLLGRGLHLTRASIAGAHCGRSDTPERE
jgi:hypothetical protein